MQHVIIGAGPAGVIAAETLRRLDPGASVKLVGDEQEPPYSRMALPYYLFDRIQEDGTHLRKQPDHFSRNGIEVLRARVTAVNTKARRLTLDGGKELGFDKLLIATGSHPIRPPIPGMDLDGIFSCWTLADGRNIAKRAGKGSRVVLMGAGFIGCIILEALAMRGVKLTVIEMGDRMVPRMMNQVAGGLIKKWCETKGVGVHTSTRVESIEKSGAALKVRLSSDKVLDADVVISATGVRSNLEFLGGSGIETDFGVKVNDRLQSSHPDVFAAGDVCQGRDFSTGEYSVQAIQPTAADHGRIAAANMAGRSVRHQGSVNMNVLDTMGLISTSYGLWMGVPGGESAELRDTDRYRYLSLQFSGDHLVGAQSLGLTEHVGVLRGLIQTRVRLGRWKDRLLKDPTRIMEAYLGCTQALGHNAGVLA
ncbi:MAG: NAD(P)/FAD-dependent oxidoreductase [Gammaproteobacteria bacterium]|nr:NAD(P)/FAD-dependent oxidoreductase [Gammaproteobacteria bacterium]